MVQRPTLTHIGGPTLLIELAGWRILVDPTFDPPGRKYDFGWGTSSVKTAGPALEPSELGAIDVVLLSHDQHADNLDDAGRAMLPDVGVVITTSSAAERLRRAGLQRVHGIEPWETATVDPEGGHAGSPADPGAGEADRLARPALSVTATPARHGPPLSRPIVGPVIGFAVSLGDAPETAVWVTGDSVLYDGLRDAAERLDVDVAVVHLGGVRFPITAAARYTMTADRAIELVELLRPRAAVPVHLDQWSHFREQAPAARRVIDAGPADVRERFVWLDAGTATEV